MKTSTLHFLVLAAAAVSLLASPLRAGQLSAERLEVLDRHGYFTPAFKDAVRRYAAAQADIDAANAQAEYTRKQLPPLKQQLAAVQANVATLKQQLAVYEHPDEGDFTALKGTLASPNASLNQKLQTVQAFIWAYPNSPHFAEAQQDLQQLQQKQSDQAQAAQTAQIAANATHADLAKRAADKSLSLIEWKTYLSDMSQEDVVKVLGHPISTGDDFWVYRGNITVDPVTGQHVGLMISFNGTRVSTVTSAPPNYQPPPEQ